VELVGLQFGRRLKGVLANLPKFATCFSPSNKLKVKTHTMPKTDNCHKKHEETQKTDVPTFGQYLACFRGFLCLFVAIPGMTFSV
jgi:hypothetical protein